MKMKKILAAILAFAMILSTAGMMASAENDSAADVVISDLAGLQDFAASVNSGETYAGKTIVLDADIDLGGVEWTPIANGMRSGSGLTGNVFSGIFDGQNHKISGLVITSGSGDQTVGFFGAVSGGTVKNLQFADANVNAPNGENVGAAVGAMTKGLVDGISVSGSVSGKAAVGGVVGRVLAIGDVQNCTNSATVVQTNKSDSAGGIVGKAYYTSLDGIMTISDCENSGNVTSDNAAGGIVGFSAANISGCTNSGTITGGEAEGGIVGEQTTWGTVSDNKNSGNIFGTKELSSAGGIVGWIRYQNNSNYPRVDTVVVTNNVNSAAISGGRAAGGIVGMMYDQGIVTYNINRAPSIAANNASVDVAGGIVGGMAGGQGYNVPGAVSTVSYNLSTTAIENISSATGKTNLYHNGGITLDKASEGTNFEEVAATINGVNYPTLKEAFDNVKDRETIELAMDIELSSAIAFTKNMTITLDGNGHKISPAAGSAEKNSAFNMGQGNDSTRATRIYNFKDIIFDGWTTEHVLRLQGVTSKIEGCTFQNCNAQATNALGLLTLTFTDATVTDCTFVNNTCAKCIDVNSWGDNSVSASIITDSVFENNAVNGPGVIYYNDGESVTVRNNTFVGNTVSTTGNGATVYMGFNDGIVVEGNLFKNNTVTTSHATSNRVAGAVFAGPVTGFSLKNNVFEGNAATRSGVTMPNSVVVSTYYGSANIDENYWGGSEPVDGVDYFREHSTYNEMTLDSYYGNYEMDKDGNIVLSNKNVVNAKSVAVVFAKNAAQSNAEEGYLVYDIVISSADGNVINRLNTADLTFEIDTDKVAYEIIKSNPQVDINPVNNRTDRYEFHFKGKTNADDTAESIVIGQVRFDGYDAFKFKVADAETNLVTATTVDDNIVDKFAKDAGLVVNTDLSDTLKGIISDANAVPTEDLTVKISFPNAVDFQADAYQDMTLTVRGEDLPNDYVISLGSETAYAVKGWTANTDNNIAYAVKDGGYEVKFEKLLTKNTTYHIVLEGAGYRTARYSVTMTDGKTVNFWNNVKDAEAVVEGTFKQTKNFLAGDLVKDNNINIYDLSAVVSYFGESGLVDNKPDYAKYDLNRDGIIDSKDVAMVLVSWDE